MSKAFAIKLNPPIVIDGYTIETAWKATLFASRVLGKASDYSIAAALRGVTGAGQPAICAFRNYVGISPHNPKVLDSLTENQILDAYRDAQARYNLPVTVPSDMAALPMEQISLNFDTSPTPPVQVQAVEGDDAFTTVSTQEPVVKPRRQRLPSAIEEAMPYAKRFLSGALATSAELAEVFGGEAEGWRTVMWDERERAGAVPISLVKAQEWRSLLKSYRALETASEDEMIALRDHIFATIGEEPMPFPSGASRGGGGGGGVGDGESDDGFPQASGSSSKPVIRRRGRASAYRPQRPTGQRWETDVV